MRKLVAVGMTAALALGVAGCKTTGGGNFAGTSGKGNFGFTYDSAKDKFAGTYRDGNVAFSFVAPTSGPAFYFCMSSSAAYRSTNPQQRGDGTLTFTACDGGEGSGASDWLSVNVDSGPYAGYSWSGPISGGNIQDHSNS